MQVIFKDFTPSVARKASKVLAQHLTNISEPALVTEGATRIRIRRPHRTAEVMDQAVEDAAFFW
jgi:hypothetical protein